MTRLNSRRVAAVATATAVLAALSPILPTQAQYVYGNESLQAKRGLARLTPEQQETMFRARKSWRQKSYSRRQSIMETERRCIRNSRDLAAFLSCRKQFKEARRGLREDFYAYINPVRRKAGLPPLEDKFRGKGKRPARRG